MAFGSPDRTFGAPLPFGSGSGSTPPAPPLVLRPILSLLVAPAADAAFAAVDPSRTRPLVAAAAAPGDV